MSNKHNNDIKLPIFDGERQVANGSIVHHYLTHILTTSQAGNYYLDDEARNRIARISYLIRARPFTNPGRVDCSERITVWNTKSKRHVRIHYNVLMDKIFDWNSIYWRKLRHWESLGLNILETVDHFNDIMPTSNL